MQTWEAITSRRNVRLFDEVVHRDRWAPRNRP